MLSEHTPGALTTLGQLSQRAPEDPFRVLIATILSHRTRDERTEQAAEQLFSVYSTPLHLSTAPPEEVERLIRPVGFYRVKARRIQEVARILIERFGGRVPTSYRTLLSLPSVGAKTANCVLVYGFGRPAIPVDTHVHRIANRLGMVTTGSPEATEAVLRRTVPRRYWLSLNELFVRFGKTICKPIGPLCPSCELRRRCRYYAEVMAKAQLERSRVPSVASRSRRGLGRTRPAARRSTAKTSGPT